MPFPWKKAKVTRITRMVADLQSPKRGGSLVVETGFPTSLIDLFVKNKDKLRRQSTNKRKNKKNNSIIIAAETLPRDPPPPPIVADEDPAISADENISPSPEVAEEPEKPSTTTAVTVATRKSRSVEVVFMAAMCVFAMAALVLSTKKVVIGFTLSTFVLLFLEFVGKIFLLKLFRPTKDPDEEDEYVAVRDVEVENRSRSLAEEIECSTIEKSRVLDSNLGEEESEKTMKTVVMVLDKNKNMSKRAKIRRKIIKNFVPKKLRSYKKSKKSKVEVVEVLKEENDEEEEEEEEGDDEIEEEESEAIDSKESCEEEGIEEVMGMGLIAIRSDNNGGRRENWVIVTVIAIVLLGLFGGRVFALLLTVLWCFVMKLIGIGTHKRLPS